MAPDPRALESDAAANGAANDALPGVGEGQWREASRVRDLPLGKELCHLLPKIELHQHITGSLPNEGVHQILEAIDPELAKDITFVTPPVEAGGPVDLKAAWDLLTRQCLAVAKATAANENFEALFAAAIETLARGNVVYCELRIGMKAQPTKRDYLALLTKVIRQQKERFPLTTIRLLLSVARHGEVQAGAENVDLAIEHIQQESEPVVVGVELGGPATAGKFADFEPLFRKAREAGLRVALHCGEDADRQDEWRAMLRFGPDRLGHCVHLDEENFQEVLRAGTPVEACLTCHYRHFGVPFSQNVFGRLFPVKQVVLGTDNPSFYQTNLSAEYELCCQEYGLTVAQLFELTRNAVEFTFLSAKDKEALRKQVDDAVESLRARFHLDAGPPEQP